MYGIFLCRLSIAPSFLRARTDAKSFVTAQTPEKSADARNADEDGDEISAAAASAAMERRAELTGKYATVHALNLGRFALQRLISAPRGGCSTSTRVDPCHAYLTLQVGHLCLALFALQTSWRLMKPSKLSQSSHRRTIWRCLKIICTLHTQRDPFPPCCYIKKCVDSSEEPLARALTHLEEEKNES